MGLKIISNGREVEIPVLAEGVYSTEETRIGTWIDGKPLYRIAGETTSPSSVGVSKQIVSTPLDIKVIFLRGTITFRNNGGVNMLPLIASSDGSLVASLTWGKRINVDDGLRITVHLNNEYFLNAPVTYEMIYTKTTDVATIDTSQMASVDLLMPETKGTASSAKDVRNT